MESKLRVQEEEEEDPELIKARIKGYTDDILLEAFGSEDRKEVSSPEDLQAEQTLKENMDGPFHVCSVLKIYIFSLFVVFIENLSIANYLFT